MLNYFIAYTIDVSETPVSRKAFSTSELIPPLLETARQAGALIMGYYRQNHVVDRKEDTSPVTEADRAADRLIVNAIAGLAPSFPMVSEEGAKPEVAGAEYFWLVDPLDGTKSFIRGKGHFTVNIGLIGHGLPVLGIIYDPVSDTLYWGSEAGAFCSKVQGPPLSIQTRSATVGREVALVSHSHLNEATEYYLSAHAIFERIACSSSIKFCLLAEGIADIYPRFGPTMEWDIAAGHAILSAAGGSLKNPDGTAFRYGKPGFLNGNFIACGY